MEAPDECGHQGDLAHKIYSIEQIDQKVAGFLIPEMERRGEPFSVLLLPDHPTPVAVRTHVSDPVPYLLYRSGESASVGRAEVYSERAGGGYGRFRTRRIRADEKIFNALKDELSNQAQRIVRF